MGGNIVTKYLGEKLPDMPKNIIGGISICQGYDALRFVNNLIRPFALLKRSVIRNLAKFKFYKKFYSAMQHMLLWSNFRRFYLYIMTENMKRVLMAHQQLVLHEDIRVRYQLCERTIFKAATLPEFDEAYTRYFISTSKSDRTICRKNIKSLLPCFSGPPSFIIHHIFSFFTIVMK